MVTSLAEHLKRETQPLHRQLEDLLQLDGALSRERYIEVLQGFAAYLRPWERQLCVTLPAAWRPFFESRRRAMRLEADLRALGAVARPSCREVRLPQTATLAEALGSMYVIEGSTLGARVVGPRLQAALGVTAEAGGSYFAGYGEETGSMWRKFRQALEECRPGTWEPAARSACQTFQGLIDIFSDETRHR